MVNRNFLLDDQHVTIVISDYGTQLASSITMKLFVSLTILAILIGSFGALFSNAEFAVTESESDSESTSEEAIAIATTSTLPKLCKGTYVPQYEGTCFMNATDTNHNDIVGQCSDLRCFSEEASWDRSPLFKDNSQIVKVRNCLRGITSFVSLSDCCNACVKTEEVLAGDDVYEVTIPSNTDCVHVCVFAHDNRYKLSHPNRVHALDTCIGSADQRCNLCDYQFMICKTKPSPEETTNLRRRYFHNPLWSI